MNCFANMSPLLLLGMFMLLRMPYVATVTVVERSSHRTPEEYRAERGRLLQAEQSQSLGFDVPLSAKEAAVNERIMALKRAELQQGFDDPFHFAPARHFFEVLDQINESPLFRVLRKMPKGAVLHAHDMALASTAAIVRATYREGLWQQGALDGVPGPQFIFSRTPPDANDGKEWSLVSKVRAQMGSDQYDEALAQLFTLYDADPVTRYRSINDVWGKFDVLFRTLLPIVTYKPVWEQYFEDALMEFFEDNVLYLEFRGVLPELYDLNGRKYTPEDVVEIYIEITDRFKKQHPTFVGTKFIYAPQRLVNNQTVDEYLRIFERLHLQYGDYVIGFDLVGQEDLGHPLLDFVDSLLTLPPTVNFLFHAGETNWNGMASDENLLDAILLGTKRIGHGYALLKHPELVKRIKERNICVEVNAISNQVLKLVADYRNHPASVLFATDYPVVISSDDPSFWKATPLSHDFYVAFLGIASAHQDLRLLKKLALNSIEHSFMTEYEKKLAHTLYNQSWDAFIELMLQELPL